MSVTFGTEGWRAIMAEEFTAENVRMVTQAIAEHVCERSTGRPVVMAVGHDTRFLSDYFARTVCEVLAGNHITSVLTDRAIPTCAVSRYVVSKQLAAGIMVTASHNPAIYNGLKVKEGYGGSATSDTVGSIEARFGQSTIRRASFDEALKSGAVTPTNMLPRYLQGIKACVDLGAIRRARLRVIVDSMHGAGGQLIAQLLKGKRCQVETLRAQTDPLFGGQAPEPIASHLVELSRAVKGRGADIGIANDGDADRLGIIAPGGAWLNPGQVMCVLLTHLVASKKLKGAVVKTVSNTMMINRVAEAFGLKLIEVPVGFKHIAKLMLEHDVLIGGEESGGIGVKGYLPERDGIFTGLLMLEAMVARGQGLARLLRDLESRYGRWFYGRRDLHLKLPQVDALFSRLQASPPSHLGNNPVVQVSQLDGVKLIGRDESWLLFRRSGTEPIVRIYAETPQRARLASLLSLGVRLAEE